MKTGSSFPKKTCEKCGQLISIAQFKQHEGSKMCEAAAKAKNQGAATHETGRAIKTSL